MRPRQALTSAVAVVGGVALAWCAWLVLRADLTTGTTVAAVLLWLLSAAAVATLTAYVREVERHHGRGSRRRTSLTPLPSLMLLWVGGLTALAAFPFMLSGSSAAGATTADPETPPPGAVDTPAASTSQPRTSPTSPSRGATRTPSPAATAPVQRPTAPPAPRASTARPTTSTRSGTTPTSSTTSSTPSPTSTTTTGPVIRLPLPTPTKTKGH
ncbi:hypothetical protein [Phycicoccus ginsengisoli]